MEEKNVYTAEEVAKLIECDAQKLRSQIKADIAQGPDGPNGTNFNGFMVGNTVKIPKKWFDKKMGEGIGPELELPELLARILMRLGMAVEVRDEYLN